FRNGLSTGETCSWRVPARRAIVSSVTRRVGSSASRNRRSRRACHGEPSVPSEFPTGFFCANVLLHEFGNDFVLVSQLGFVSGDTGFKLGDPPVLGVRPGSTRFPA